MKLLVVKSSPLARYLIPLGPTCRPQYPILEDPHTVFLPQCEREVSHPCVEDVLRFFSQVPMNCCKVDVFPGVHGGGIVNIRGSALNVMSSEFWVLV